MVQNQPKQSRTPRLANVKNFVRVVKNYLAKYQWTQKDLAVAADMTEAMISRMFRDQNGRGDTFDLTPVMVMKIACAYFETNHLKSSENNKKQSVIVRFTDCFLK